jgi:putative transposase
MAETKRMTADEVVGYMLEGEGLDFLRESLLWVVRRLLEAEVSHLIGAERGERAPEERLTHRDGCRSRAWSRRAVELELPLPKLRRGSSLPSFLEPRKRSEQAPVSVVQEAHVAGVSTRKVDQVGWTPSWRRFATAAASCARASCSPTGCTSPATGR